MTPKIKPIVIASALFLALGQVHAEKVYKSVDAEGRVSFSDQPATDAVATEKVKIAPGPSAQDVQAAKQRHRAIEAMANQPANPAEQEADGRKAELKAARKQLQAAEERLEDAKQPRAGDRRGVVSPSGATRTRLTPEYLERVKTAEDDVEAARRALEELR